MQVNADVGVNVYDWVQLTERLLIRGFLLHAALEASDCTMIWKT